VKLLSIHRVEGSDWAGIKPSKYNFWQRHAANSRGVIAPANLVSLIGALIVYLGLLIIYKNHIITGLIVILVGRSFDIIDGIVADKTGTKSSVGEVFDAVIDKTILLSTLIFLLFDTLVPIQVYLVMVIHGIYNICLGAISKTRRITLHPDRSGKYSTAFGWLSLLLFVLTNAVHNLNTTHTLRTLAWILFGLFVLGAFLSSVNYSVQIFGTLYRRNKKNKAKS
jgi:phosphatidylglycerophosphate synthase